MEANKENKRSETTKKLSKTKIPVPVKPLPLLPKHLITKTANQPREPLRTIHFSNANLASSSQLQKTQEETKIKRKVTLKSSVRHVITYSKFKKDWAQNVFKDDEVGTAANDSVKSDLFDEVGSAVSGNDSIKSKPNEVFLGEGWQNIASNESSSNHDTAFVFSDEDIEKNETALFSKDEQMLDICMIDHLDVTPASFIEHRGVRNIKKSLKRPHSRELQGLSPAVKDKTAEDKAKRRLNFDRLEDKLLASGIWNESYTTYLSEVYTSDIFSYLRLAECKPRSCPYLASITRACAINWLLKINGKDGNPAVIQTACWYLDTYLSETAVPLVKLQVVAAACYWIAQKHHGPMFTASKMVFCSDNAFTADSLRATEMTVLSELNFPLQPIVAQEFITYLSWWCDKQHSWEIEMAATFLCLAGLMVDKSLCKELPSVIAAASVKNAVMLLGKSHLMNRLIMCPEYQKCVQKLSNQHVGTYLRHAVRTISNPLYEYKVLLEHYNRPPFGIAEKVVDAANRLTIQEPKDNRKTSISFKL